MSTEPEGKWCNLNCIVAVSKMFLLLHPSKLIASVLRQNFTISQTSNLTAHFRAVFLCPRISQLICQIIKTAKKA